MHSVFVKAAWDGEIKLGSEAIKYLKDKKIKSVALFASVQFVNLNEAIKQLKNLDIKVLTTKAKRASEEVQILGCDAYCDSFRDDIINKADLTLYIGDGLFHPKALLLSQVYNKDMKDVLVYNPLNKKISIMTKKDIEPIIKKLKANLKLFIMSECVGIIITTKPGQMFLKSAENLKEILERQGKKVYIFIDNTIDMAHFEDYPFVDVWVNTACPRFGLDDALNSPKPLINISYVYDAVKSLDKLNQQ